MSTLKVDTYLTRGGASEIAIDKLKGVTAAGSMLVVAEGGTTTTNLQQGLNKAWHLASNDSALSDSFNVSGGTDNGTGDYSYALSNSMNSANYSVAGVCAEDATRNQHTKARATGSYTVKHANLDNEAARDCANSSNVCGDLA